MDSMPATFSSVINPAPSTSSVAIKIDLKDLIPLPGINQGKAE